MRHFPETVYAWYLVGLSVRRATVMRNMSLGRNPGLMTGAPRPRFVPFLVWVCSVVHLFGFLEDWMDGGEIRRLVDWARLRNRGMPPPSRTPAPRGRATATPFATMASSPARHGGVASAVVSDAAPFRRPPPAGDARRTLGGCLLPACRVRTLPRSGWGRRILLSRGARRSRARRATLARDGSRARAGG